MKNIQQFSSINLLSNTINNSNYKSRVIENWLPSQKIINKDKKNIGKITSGGFSPTLNISIAIAYIDKFVSEKVDKLYCLINLLKFS